ncbi:alpha/beta fold hydrolase [uncultured Pseudoteredinibacter sp.]|uniref:alpha/beta hydrolase family protein n=1 Tax=uncultured Pseudoteredinibacter sp. TaxID=1641701 RepID=UPI0026052266|nr:alpha/beta fold hydrolase [uncultured Pseudoteredinibacter sp.]
MAEQSTSLYVGKILHCNDGYPLAYRHYPSRGSDAAKAVVIIGSALGVSHNFYRRFAEYLCEHGYECLSFDYRGTGEQSESLSANVSTEHWGILDIEAVIQEALASGRPVHFIGHSIGGQLLGLAPSATKLSSITLVAASAPYWKRWQGTARFKIWLLSFVLVPVLARLNEPFPIAALGLGNIRIPSRCIARWAQWMRGEDYLLSAAYGLERSGYEAIECPLWSIGFSDDELAPENNIRYLVDFFSNSNSTVDMLKPEAHGLKRLGHNGLFQKQSRDALWPKILSWLDANSKT